MVFVTLASTSCKIAQLSNKRFSSNFIHFQASQLLPVLKGRFSLVPRSQTNLRVLSQSYCSSNLPYEQEETTVQYRNGVPVVNVMLPSRDERCLFTLRPLTDTVGTFLAMVKDEDGGVEHISVYRKDGAKISKATTIDMLLHDDFDLIINSRKFSVTPPKLDIQRDEEETWLR
ncbi:MCU [Bugula neritina]|uniref:MCU n=1 Tax=Bugula neritina TaxID=10212 RepID=A0A7J7IZJ5_BUGNE|nr:MCU [Bugula neritina]